MKIISFKKSVFSILGGVIVFLVLFASCDNFLKGGEVSKEIEEAIAYNNAKEISILIQPEEGTGSTVPNGINKVKKGYDFEINFSENPAFSFIKWTAVTNDNSKSPVTDGVIFEDATSPKTKVKISNEAVSIRILPVCEERIAVSGEPSPRYDTLGVSRDRSISVSFTKPLAESSFIFEEKEVPAGAQVKKDFDGKIWAYTFEGKTYLKNVSITNNDDFSIAEHFTKPEVNGKLLVIGTDRTNPIEFNVGEVFKTVKVTLSKDITDTSGIKMNSSKSWNYQITESTDEKATVNLTSVALEGSVYLAGQRDYSLGQKITLAFTEDADYQFVKWEYDSRIIYIADPDSVNTTATIIEKTIEEEPTQIKAICAPRLRVTSFEPKNDSSKPYVSKNSSIVIVFNQNIPNDDDNKAQLNNISIALGGTPVMSSFKAPYISSNTITFIADNSNMLDVPAGQKKTVSVTIPADFYYTLQDGTKVTYGGNGSTFDYKIDDTTLDKAEITFAAPANSGEFTAAKGTNNYSIGQEVAVAFEPKDGWQFNGWTVKSGNDEIPESQIKLADKTALSTKLYVYEAVQGVTVLANASEILTFTGSPSGTAAKPKDSEIVITFNKNLAEECKFMLDKIRISSDGNSIDSYYTNRSLSSDVITIKNTSSIAVPKGSTKIITVTVPEDFYYNDGATKIYLAEKSFNFTVDYTTNAKTKVYFKIINGESDLEFNPASAAGSINQAEYQPFNIDEEVPLAVTLNTGYQFCNWKITDANGNLVKNQISFKNSSSTDLEPTLVMNEEASNIYVNALCYKRPVVSTSTVQPYNANTATEFAKNEPIVITFDHAIRPETKDDIVVDYSGVANFNKSIYFSTTISSDNKTITLTPIKMLPLNNATETVSVTVPHDKIYYIAQNGKTKITCADSDFSWSYKINNSTMTKTTVRFATTDAAVTGRQITVGGTVLSSGVSQDLNEEQVVELEFPVESGYEFAGWKITPAASGYTCTSDTYLTKGTVLIKNGDEPYLSLVINGNKAVLTSVHAIGNGTDGYGITVSAKDVLLPVVESVKVNNKTNIYNTSNNICDSKIYINFNKYIAQDSVDLSYTGSITITKNGSPTLHYENYFTPSWKTGNNQNGYKTLILTPKQTITQLVPNTSDRFDFVITLNANGKKIRDKANYVLQKSESINNSFDIVYTISGERERNNPTLKGGLLFNKEPKTEGSVQLSTNHYGKWSANDFNTNHLTSSIFMLLAGVDDDSGISHFKVTETLLQKLNNEDVDSTPVISTYTATDNQYYGTHTLKTLNDGIIQIDLQAVDNANNESEKVTYYVIKNTVIDIGDKMYDIKIIFNAQRHEMTNEYNKNELNQTGLEIIQFNFLPEVYPLPVLGNNKWLQNIYTKIIWSYDENEFDEEHNIVQLVDNKGIYEFRHDPLKITYLKIVLYDNIGNEQTYMRFIPARPDFGKDSFIQETYQSGNGNTETWYSIRPAQWDKYKEYDSKFDLPVQTEIEYFRNQNLYSKDGKTWLKQKEVTEYGHLDSLGPKIDPSKWEPGDYYINVSVANGKIGSTDQVYYASILSDTTLLLRKEKSGNISCEIGSLKNQNSYIELQTGYKPYLIVKQIEPKTNTGNCTVTVWPDEIKSDDSISYTLRAENLQTHTCFDFTEFDAKNQMMYLNLPTPAEYRMRLIIKVGNKVNITDPLVIIKDNHDYETLLLTADCTPPIFSGSSIWSGSFPFAYNMMYSNWYPTNASITEYSNSYPVDESGMYHNNDGLGEITYWILPNYQSSTLFGVSFTEEELNTTYAGLKKTITYDLNQYALPLDHDNTKHQSRIEIPYDNLDEGSYVIGLRAQDVNGNYSYYFQPICNRLLNEKMKYNITSTKLKFTHAHASYMAENFHFYYFDTTSNRWIGSDKADNVHLTSSIDHPAGLRGHWGRLVGFRGSDSNSAGFFDIEYVYLDYERYKGTANEMTLNLKNVIPGMTGLQIYCDQPTLVHTLYCSKKLTETSEEEDIAVWENKGTETGIVVKNSNFSYSKDYYYNSIPNGAYYTTVVHFADGTKVMSEVKQKP